MRHIDYELDYFTNENKKREEIEKMKRKDLIKNLEDYKMALINVDMVEGFVNFGAMADQSYNALVPEQMKIMDDYIERNEFVGLIGEWHDENSREFDTYPVHCVKNTAEAEFIPEIRERVYKKNENGIYIKEDGGVILNNGLLRTNGVLKENIYDYGKNSINGMLNGKLREDVTKMENLAMVVFNGVCEDLCVEDAARTFARLMDELNREVAIYVVANTVDTFDAPYHNRNEWKTIARKVLEQAGIKYVENYEELKEEEKKLGLR